MSSATVSSRAAAAASGSVPRSISWPFCSRASRWATSTPVSSVIGGSVEVEPEVVGGAVVSAAAVVVVVDSTGLAAAVASSQATARTPSMAATISSAFARCSGSPVRVTSRPDTSTPALMPASLSAASALSPRSFFSPFKPRTTAAPSRSTQTTSRIFAHMLWKDIAPSSSATFPGIIGTYRPGIKVFVTKSLCGA